MARRVRQLNKKSSFANFVFMTFWLALLVNPYVMATAGQSTCWRRRFQLFKGYALSHHVVKTQLVHSRTECESLCISRLECLSYNYEEKNTGNICEINNATRGNNREHLISKLGSSYWEDLDAWKSGSPVAGIEPSPFPTPQSNNKTFGRGPHFAARSCKQIKTADKHAKSGLYWLNFDISMHPENAFQAYCDHETDGGGWTLVWSYTFTNYENFTSYTNAVTPRPRWPWGRTEVPLSTVVPRNETHFAAMDRDLWYKLGSDFLVKSNINHWISCRQETGSLLHWWYGKIICKNVKNVTKRCHGNTPNYLNLHYCGPRLSFAGGRDYYYFDNCVTAKFPAHDPCGFSGDISTYYKKRVDNPHGNLFFR